MKTLERRLESIRVFAHSTTQLDADTRQWLLDVIDGTDGAPSKTPADKLADVCDEVGRCGCGCGSKVKAALEEYRSTRNGIGQTFSEAVGSPPDPIKVARLLLDSLTGGALSSLIRDLRDHIFDESPMYADAKCYLRALGEKIED